MFQQIHEMVKRFEEIEKLLSAPETASSPPRMSALMKERGRLTKVVIRYRQLESIRGQQLEAEKLLNENGHDHDMKKMALDEIQELKKKEESILHELESILVTDDTESSRNVIVEIRPGTGGEEASLFSSELLRMYLRYAELKGWKSEIVEQTVSDMGGIKQVVFSLEGEDAYKFLRYESGTHRVQRVPKTEAQGRIHTSACTVAVLPEAEEVEIEINRDDLRIDAYRAGGAGGQHVNKTSSAIRITHLPTGIVAACQVERSQHRNKDMAMRWLRAKLYEHFQSQKKAARDNLRKTQIGTGDRSEKIRTYNYPQSRITDHRINFSVHNMEEVLDGHMDNLLQALLDTDKEEKLKLMREGKIS